MKATVLRADLLPALELICKLVGAKSAMPILANVVLEGGDDGITLRATDLESEMIIFVPAKVEQPGAVLASAKMVLGTLRALGDDGEIVIDSSKKNKVAFGSANFIVPGPVEEMPSAWESESVDVRETNGDFLRALRAVTFAASTDPTRYALNGVCYDRAQKRLVATDGHRLAFIAAPELFVKGGAKGADIIIPSKAAVLMSELGKKFAKCAPSIGVAAPSFKGKFQVGPARLMFKCVDAQFPEYQRVIPHEERDEFIVKVERKRLEKALKMALKMSKSRAVKVRVNSALRLTTSDPDTGESSQEVEAKIQGKKGKNASKELLIGFNADYLLEGCKYLPKSELDDEIEMGFDDAFAPVRFRAGGDMIYVVMPMRI